MKERCDKERRTSVTEAGVHDHETWTKYGMDACRVLESRADRDEKEAQKDGSTETFDVERSLELRNSRVEPEPDIEHPPGLEEEEKQWSAMVFEEARSLESTHDLGNRVDLLSESVEGVEESEEAEDGNYRTRRSS